MSLLFDVLSAASIIGIWPRFIEPKRLKVTEIDWPVFRPELAELKIAHISDLHLHKNTPEKFIAKIVRTINNYAADIVVFTGDFLCYSNLDCPERLLDFLNQLKTPLGGFCIFGNHDYSQYLTLNSDGIYDLAKPPPLLKAIKKGIYTLVTKPKKKVGNTAAARQVPLHDPLCALIESSSFKLLDNETITLPIGLNITGLGDLSAGRCDPKKAFNGFDLRYPGIALSHNPDSVPLLLDSPAEWVLAGHTHGEQIHLPWPQWGRTLSRKLARLQNVEYTRGFYQLDKEKKLYVNRGLGCHKPIRVFSPPEICFLRAVYEN